jgi:hypothetical protein
MANPNPVPLDPRFRFRPGQSGNPGGTAKGARNRLTGAFLNDLEAHYAEKGKKAFDAVLEDDPVAYVTMIARLLPKEVEVTNVLDDLDNDALRIVMAAAQRYVERQRAAEMPLVSNQTPNGSSSAELP